MNEKDKDWTNPAFANIYVALAMADIQEADDSIPNWLNANGFCNLTCCPECHVDDFVHVERCSIAAKMDVASNQLEALLSLQGANAGKPQPVSDHPEERQHKSKTKASTHVE